jgi:hypothetical protein
VDGAILPRAAPMSSSHSSLDRKPSTVITRGVVLPTVTFTYLLNSAFGVYRLAFIVERVGLTSVSRTSCHFDLLTVT